MKNHAQKIREVLNGAKGKTQGLLSYSLPSPGFQVSRVSIITLSILEKNIFFDWKISLVMVLTLFITKFSQCWF